MPQQLSFAPGSPVVITVRPERLSVVDAAAGNTLTGKLLVSTPHGPNVIHSLELGDGTEVKITEPRDRRLAALEASARHFIALDVMNLHVFQPVRPNNPEQRGVEHA